MSQKTTSLRNLSAIGEEISHELGAKMVKDFQDQYPTEETGNFIGRDILESILKQPGCTGISFYNAINESGRKTLVCVGLDDEAQIITRYSTIDTNGKLITRKGIVADRNVPTPPTDSPDSTKGWFD